MKYFVLLLGLSSLLLSCAWEDTATPDLTATFDAAVSAELTRLAPAPTIAVTVPNAPTPTLAAVATAIVPQSDPTPTLVPSPTLIPIELQAATADKQGIAGDVFAREELLISADPAIFGAQVSFFLVGAVDSAVGVDEGDGVQDVVFTIFDATGNLVYQKVETTAAYCAFGGDFPCAPHDFSQNDFLWPSGLPLEAGTFSAEIIARGTNPDSTTTWTYEFQIQLEP